jgi:hypothetical protein
MEYEVPDPAGDSVTLFHPARAVVVQVISLEIPEEERLYAKGDLTDDDRDRLAKIRVELDQC